MTTGDNLRSIHGKKLPKILKTLSVGFLSEYPVVPFLLLLAVRRVRGKPSTDASDDAMHSCLPLAQLEGRGPITCKRLWAVAYPVSKQTGRKFVPLQLQSLTTVCSFRHMQLHEQDWHPYVPSIFPNQFRYMLICQ